MTELLLRCDAGPERGTGHLMRCLALAEAWTAFHDEPARFACAEIPAPLAKRVEAAGHELARLSCAPASEEDRDAVRGLAERSDAIVVDGYHFDPPYLSAIESPNTSTVYIDDLVHQDAYPVDVVLNPIPSYSPEDFPSAGPDTRFLLGPDYILLRPEFRAYLDWERDHPKQVHRLLVSMGGADPDNATRWVLESLAPELGNQIAVDVVVGAANRREDELASLVDELPEDSRLHVDVDRIAPLMEAADLAVTAGGTMAWEMAYMQVPTALLQIADNQAPVARGLANEDAAIDLGAREETPAQKLRETYRQLAGNPKRRRELGERGRDTVDGLGSQRVVQELTAP